MAHIRLSSPHEAGGGTNSVPEYARGKWLPRETIQILGSGTGRCTIERWRNKVDAMVTGRVAPMILLAVWVSSLGFAGRSNARRALDSNPLM